MFTRSAIFEGKIKQGKEHEFYDIIENKLVPVWRRMPNVQAVRIFKPVAKDSIAPAVVLVQQIDYPSIEAIDEAMASSVRAEAVEITKEIDKIFDGKLYHYIYDKTVEQ